MKQEELSLIRVGYKLFSPSGPPMASQFDAVGNSWQSHDNIVKTPLLPLHLSENLSNLVIIPGSYLNSSLRTIENSGLRLKFGGISALGFVGLVFWWFWFLLLFLFEVEKHGSRIWANLKDTEVDPHQDGH